jgi:hypothetical protein
VKVSVLRPFGGAEDAWRSRARAFTVAWWEHYFPAFELIEGAAGEPWSKGAAIADAFEQCSGDLVVLADADSIVDHPSWIRKAVDAVAAGAPWAIPHRLVYRLRDRETTRLLDLDDPTAAPRLGWVHRTPYEGVAGGGFVVLSRSTFELVGGIDARFLGWGGEDVALGWALDTLAGPATRFPGRLVHLWHPHPAPNLRGSPESEELVAEYRSAIGLPERMAAIVAGTTWETPEPLPAPVRFVTTGARQWLRLPTGARVECPGGRFETVDPELVELLRRHKYAKEITTWPTSRRSN